MKKQYIYIFMVCLSALFSCVRIDESELGGEQEPVEKIKLSIDAVIEKAADTRTALEGTLEDEVMRTVWVPSDTIGVVAWRSSMGNNETVEKFRTDITENAETATFEGTIASSLQYHAFYPYQPSLRNSNNRFVFELSQNQRYVAGSFDPEATPMVAKAAYGKSFDFQNLCGLLALKMTGEETVKAITFIGKDEAGSAMPLSGTAIVNMSYEDEPDMVFTDMEVLAEPAYGTSVTLTCDTPVQLSETAVPFYFVLPPATYSSFMIMVHTADGKVMVKEATKPITIERSHVKPTAALQYAESVYVNLSETGWANSYIVSEAGMYAFDADIIGNGDFGLLDDVDFHTTDVKINPSSVEILWQDRENVIAGPALVNGQVRFYAMGNEGNALVAVKDEAGTILWSWHIWVTDQPGDHVYVNDYGTFTVQDRNLGATRNDRGEGDEWAEARGLHYQWGRKDPFAHTYSGIYVNTYLYTNHTSSKVSISYSIENPTLFIGCGSSSWEDTGNASMWTKSQKTIYDPCPPGYMVIDPDAWRGFTSDGYNQYNTPDNYRVASAFDMGWNFLYDGVNSAYYPASDYIYRNGNYQGTFIDQGRMWSSSSSSTQDAYRLHYYNNEWDSGIEPYGVTDRFTYGQSVRCMKDEGHVDTSYPVVRIESINSVTSDSAKIEAEVMHGGISTVTERGLIWGTDKNLTIDSGTKEVIGEGEGRFSKTLTGLTHSTRYYVRAYAINDLGVGYSEVDNFYTPYQGEAIDLSISGTANSYVVPPVFSTYTFDATVKGHTNETIDGAASVEVLWETDKYGMKTTVGQLIENVTFANGRITFNTKESDVEGNALIAVKDADGTILWSWHLWVTDIPAEQTYVNNSGTFIVQDRNLGATRADRGVGDEWKESCGLDYQWGRKDPFAGAAFTEESSAFSIESSIMNPTLKYSNWDWGPSADLWSETQKTMYDPCPVGYRVAESDVWQGFGEKISGSYDNGWNVTYDGLNTTWYPNRAHNRPHGIDYWDDSYMTAAARYSGLHFSGGGIIMYNVADGQLRCMTDEAHLDMTYPEIAVTAINDITSESATVVANVDYTGSHEITERGIVWGTNVELDIHHGTKEVLGSGAGEFSTSLTGLTHSTRYYVRAYVINDTGIWYSKEMSFYTPYEGGSVNLSANGTANSYIVPPVYSSYVFDATVKGNSTESVGTPATAEVLWETQLTSNALEVGCLIESIELVDGQVKFQLPFDPKPGNALVAVKDADGTILWSWHIWVVDFDPVRTGQVYISGNMLMDRNLGALSTVPTSADYGAYGLFYQWGRKDPFLIPDRGTTAPADAITAVLEDLTSIESTIAVPTVVYDQSYWGDDATLWSSVKTKYDPCPAGWRVPDKDLWDGIESSNLTTVNSTYRIIPEPYSVPQAYYPMSGVGDGNDGDYNGQWTDWFNDYSSWWTTERAVNMWVHWNDDFRIINREVDRRMSVRCMKDARFEVVTKSTSGVTGSSFTASGEYTSLDGTEITEVGFAYSEHTSEPTIARTDCGYVKVAAGSPFTATVTGLKPNTQYYVRAYAKGGYNVKYGECVTVTTGSAGSGEGFDNGGDYEWGE